MAGTDFVLSLHEYPGGFFQKEYVKEFIRLLKVAFIKENTGYDFGEGKIIDKLSGMGGEK